MEATEDRTASVVAAAKGRLVARHRHRAELERIESASQFHTYQRYLEETVKPASDASLSRIMYLCERAQGGHVLAQSLASFRFHRSNGTLSEG
jgi:hypothetical protein